MKFQMIACPKLDYCSFIKRYIYAAALWNLHLDLLRFISNSIKTSLDIWLQWSDFSEKNIYSVVFIGLRSQATHVLEENENEKMYSIPICTDPGPWLCTCMHMFIDSKRCQIWFGCYMLSVCLSKSGLAFSG